MNFCYKTASVWLFIGKLLFILKILIPIAIIVLGSIDLGKAVISSDDKSIKTACRRCGRLLQTVKLYYSSTISPLASPLVDTS